MRRSVVDEARLLAKVDPNVRSCYHMLGMVELGSVENDPDTVDPAVQDGTRL